MTSLTMPTVAWNDLLTPSYVPDGPMGMMNTVPSPGSYSNSSDSQESSNMSMASPMPMQLSPHHLIYLTEDEVVGAPYLKVREEPVEKFRFRYKSEMMGTHGSILGRSADKSRKKSYPSVELCNYNGPAMIRCSLYTAHPNESQRTPHTHRLVVRVDADDKDDPHDIYVSQEVGYIAVFQGMGIIHTAKKNIADELVKKKRFRFIEQQKLRNINAVGLTTKDEAKIRHEAEQEAKKMNLNSVTLCFEAFRTDENGLYHPICKPVFSKTINNMKSALTGELKICRIDKHVSSCMGGEEVFILVEKVGKKNIKIRFFEVDDEDNEIWCDFGKFSELDVHHQYAIVFKTPPYRDLEIEDAKEVFLQLYRPTDGDCSEPIKFSYRPSDKIGRSRKRHRSSLEQNIPVVIETNQKNFVNTTFNQMMDTERLVDPHTGHVQTQNEPMLSGDSHELLQQILNESDDNNLDSSDFREFMKNLSLSELPWLPKRQWGTENNKPVLGNMMAGTENGKPSYNHFMDPAFGISFSIPTDFESSGYIKMEHRTSGGYCDTLELGEPMHDLATDGPKEKSTLEIKPEKPIDKVSVLPSNVIPSKYEPFIPKSTQAGNNNSTIKKLDEEGTFDPDTLLNIKQEIDKPVQTCSSEILAERTIEQLTQILKTKPPPHEFREKVCTIFSEWRTENGDGPLHTAILNEQKDFLKQMLTAVGRVKDSHIINLFNFNAETPLHLAVLCNQPDTVKALLAVGADPNAVTRKGNTPLHMAIEKSYHMCIAQLLNKENYLLSNYEPRVDVRNYNGWTPLHLAALFNNLPAIQKLVAAKANVNEVDSTCGRTVLHLAVEEGYKDIVEFLVKHTAVEVNKANYAGNTALHMACVIGDEGSTEIVRLLIDSKADPHKQNYSPKLDKPGGSKDDLEMEVKVKQEPESEEDDDDEGRLRIVDHIRDDDDDDDDDDDEEDIGKELPGHTSFDLAIDNKEILELLKKVEEVTERRTKTPEEDVEVKEEICDSPLSQCNISEENGLFDEDTFKKLCEHLDKSKGWVDLADLLDYGFMVPNIRTATSPSKLLLNYADLHGSVTVRNIRDFLEALDEHHAVEIIDLMLTRQLMSSQMTTC